MNLRRWLIEASYSPLVFAIVILYYIESIDNVLDEYPLIYVFTMMHKVPLFFLMRYAEGQPDCFVNKFEAYLVNRYCLFLLK